jgi:hypothetical protein
MAANGNGQAENGARCNQRQQRGMAWRNGVAWQ